jgi:PAS domain S-box-containing protein
MDKIVSLSNVPLENAESHLAAIVDSSFDAIIRKDLSSVIRSWNKAAEVLFGYSSKEAIGQSILMLIPDHLQSEEIEIITRIRAGERVETFETIRLRKDGTLVPISLTISPIRNANGEVVGASKIARDITFKKESERRTRLLLREVNHRVKNQFAVILSMVRETLKRSTDPQEFEQRIRERIMALARSHDLLVDAEWEGTSLFDLIQEHLKPFGHEDQIVLNGPLVTLQPNAVQYLGIALHELGTNSAKYGALSTGSGRISVSWQAANNRSGEREFTLTWEETSALVGSRRTTLSKEGGFGGIVLQRVAPEALSGSAVLDRRPGYVRWSLTAPFERSIVFLTTDEREFAKTN